MSLTQQSARWAFNCRNWKPTQAEVLVASAVVQDEEKERINQFHFLKDAKSSLIGRLLMRKYLSDIIGDPWESFRLNRSESGKPIYPGFVFNVSHSGSFTVFAGESGDGQLGVDVMEMEYPRGNTQNFFRLMRRNLSDEEWRHIEDAPTDREQMNRFYRNWCLKESFVKATGTGITVNLQEISFRIPSSRLNQEFFVEDTQVFLRGRHQPNWLFQEILLDDQHCVAVALSQIKSGEICKFSFVDFSKFPNSTHLQGDIDFCQKFLSKQS